MKMPSGFVFIAHINRKGTKVELEQKELITCKECKHFEYDSMAKVDGMPLIVAHEICNKWGNGCKTSENGWCFMAEPIEEEGAKNG